jgi:pyridoxamine 5'-phosphate oxidase
MPHTLWRPSLVLALYQNRNAPNARFVQMATVRTDGLPANRSLVFRGFLHDAHQLTFATDTRGRKTAELAAFPRAELCWYFPVTHVQFRIGGTITLVGEDTGDPTLEAARRDTWRALPEATRVSFTWPAPGLPRDSRVPFPTHHPDPLEPLPHFGLIVLDPLDVDYLELNGTPQNRWVYRRDQDGRWSGAEVNP